jgi:hypothetical protein
MALRVYPALHPFVNLGRKKAPGLAPSFSEWISREDTITSHLLNCFVVKAKHARNLTSVHKVFTCCLSPTGSNFSIGHCFLIRSTVACFASGDTE